MSVQRLEPRRHDETDEQWKMRIQSYAHETQAAEERLAEIRAAIDRRMEPRRR